MNYLNKWQYFALILIGFSRPILAATLIGYNGSIEGSPSVALDNGTALLNAPWFNASLPTVIYCHGFREVITNNSVTNISGALYEVYSTEKNILILNWDNESSDGGLGRYLGYVMHAVPGAKTVAAKLAELIVNLVSQGVNKDIHIIGHSLGAQLAGMCGAKTLDSGFNIPRISGLDPAGPVFDLDVTNTQRLDATDADFVDCYHTNSGNLGSSTGTGDVDIWFNYSADLPVMQPGCETESSSSDQNLCSHQRSVYYFCESIRNFTAFVAAKSATYATWVAGITNGTAYVGQAIDTSLTGGYFLTTNSKSPYGKGEEGATYSSS